jgi:prepilin-type N-terminal cleavage/methylation domain-containing protein
MRRAFTLFETVLVMALLVILAAIAYPSIEGMYGYYKLQAAADTVRGHWAEARTRAMEEGRAYRFAVIWGKGNFRVAPDGADFWSGNDAAAADSSGQPPLMVSDALPKGIPFRRLDTPRGDGAADTVLPTDSVDPGQWSTVAIFLPDGTAREDVDVVLDNGARVFVVKLRALTGGVSVRPLEGGRR